MRIALLSLVLVSSLSACTHQLVRVKDLTEPGPAKVTETTTVTRDSGGVKVTTTTTNSSEKTKLAAQLELAKVLGSAYPIAAANNCMCGAYYGGRGQEWYAQQAEQQASSLKRKFEIDSANAVNEARLRNRPPQ